jgi:3-oxoacyl-[acyl-carrier protein] reductase
MSENVVIITGAAKGIGRGIALVFAREGATVVVADVDELAGSAAAASLAGTGGIADFVPVDVAKRASSEAAVLGVIEKHGTGSSRSTSRACF